MPVCHRRKLAFCHIPRTAGVSIVRALKLEVIDKHYPASFYRNNFPDYTLFTVIRSDEDRIESATYARKGDAPVRESLMCKPNSHFLDCEVDYTLRFEHLQEDLNAMLSELKIPPVKLQHTNSFKTMNITRAIQDANRLQSKLSDEVISAMDGLSSPKVWHLLNSLASQAKTYLEVGLYKGSTLISALHGNEHLTAFGVDNFSMFPNKRQNFFANTNAYKNRFTLFEQDCWTVDLSKLPPIELFFYDGDHSFEAQYKAIEYFYPAMADEFTYVCDDWNMKKIPNATFSAAKAMNLEVIENHDLICPQKGEWWNGIGIVRFKKQQHAKQD
ncbi:MAG TPA: class I SAM-dependent methyltransferase [Cyclobacteriaceae bacterium]